MRHALIILGHGSRVGDASADMEQVAQGVRLRHPGVPIRIAHMELCEPSLEQVVQQLVAEGHRSILILPYFLHRGRHMREDIPALLATLAQQNPELILHQGEHLGFDESLVELVARRWRAFSLAVGE